MFKVATIFGTRPEAIKIAPVISELSSRSERVNVTNIVTAQHREMLDPLLRLFSIKVHYDLSIMTKGQTLTQINMGVLDRLDPVLSKEKPDLVLVQGDTTTTFVASLTAFYHRIPVGHIEAGLRTKNKYYPFPEEVNRRLTTHVADIHFAPTEGAMLNLLNEGVNRDQIFVTGNTIVDALFTFSCKGDHSVPSTWEKIISRESRVIVLTAHRRENHGRPLEHICEAIREIVANNRDVEVIYPVHLNPNVKCKVDRLLHGQERIHLIEPLDYGSFVLLMQRAFLILTDSGGIQEEAPYLGKPVLVLRSETERPEGVDCGSVLIVGTEKESIVKETQSLLDDRRRYRTMTSHLQPYGDGTASKRIVDTIVSRFCCDRGASVQGTL
jgi:UDP-N-acetylglucosamine 2-epimerase (non-hydrolysing)